MKDYNKIELLVILDNFITNLPLLKQIIKYLKKLGAKEELIETRNRLHETKQRGYDALHELHKKEKDE